MSDSDISGHFIRVMLGLYYMSSQKVADLRAYEVRTVNRTLDEATGMSNKVTRAKRAGRVANAG